MIKDDERTLFKWQKIQNLNIKLAAHSLIFHKDSLYFILGEKEDALYFENISNEITEFSFVKKSLKTTTIPLKRMFATCCQKNENLCFFGGHNIEVQSDSFVYQFNLETSNFQTLKAIGNPPESRRYHCSTILDDKMWIFGGELFNVNLHPMTDELFSFDLKTRVWKLMAPFNSMKPSKRRYSTIQGKNSILYVFGGRDEIRRMNDMWEFDIGLENWKCVKTTGDIPPVTAACSSVLNGNSIFYFGGNIGQSTNNLYEYDTIKCHWRKIEAYGVQPPSRFWHSAVMNQFNEMIIHGGYNDSFSENRSDIFKIHLPKRNKNLKIDIESLVRKKKFLLDVGVKFF
jgi:N-acetylneuraminic acid mutarotase